MNFLLTTAIIILFFGSFFISDSFAVDYRDSSGYTPSWAQGAGYHSVLLKCTEMVGDYTSDGNWCFEWTAYVLDQGVENFPESTKSSSSTSNTYNLSERICAENKICVFTGEFLKYQNSDTYDNFSEIAIVEFKNKIDTNSIRFFSNGFGNKPLTYNLNLNTGIETHDKYTNVNRPFNLLEPIPMKIGQEVSQYMKGYFESTISEEKTVNLKELGLMDVTRVLMIAKTDLGGGDTVIRVYDKETGVLITNVEKYHLDGKKFTSGIVLVDTNIFSVPTKIPSKTQSSTTTTNSNTLQETTPKKPNSIVSGNYLEHIVIENQNYDYEITAKLGPKSPDTSYIRIIAENECPFKKQIYQKDFQNRPGTEVSFSFYQPSQSKPSECSIHFTLSSFQGQELETITAKYYLEIPEIKINNPIQSPESSKSSIVITSDNTESKKSIPSWVKNNAKWWADDTIDDDTFKQGIQHMIKEKIINIEDLPSSSGSSESKIPPWIKQNAKWWADGIISEDDFINGIEYLVGNGMIVISNSDTAQNIPVPKESTVQPPVYTSPYDPEIVKSAKANIPSMQSPFRAILKQCNSVNSYSDYEVFVTAIAMMQDQLIQNTNDVNAILTTLELAGYDEHPEVGPLIKETRNLALNTSSCIDRVLRIYS